MDEQPKNEEDPEAINTWMMSGGHKADMKGGGGEGEGGRKGEGPNYKYIHNEPGSEFHHRVLWN